MLRRTSLVSVTAVLGVLSIAVLPSAAAPRSPAATSAPKPPAQSLSARSALPPGESGFFPIAAQSSYAANQHPSDFGPHVDDQRQLYWNNKTKPDDFATPTGTPVVPRNGVKIYRDSYGVPLIYGKTGYDVWFGAAYAEATDRLFEMDAIRRLGEGRLAELTGSGAVPGDLQERTVTYTHHEYKQMFKRLPRAGRQAIAGYAAGAEARIKQVRANPSLLPGEYVLLSSLPVKWTIEDSMAAGVYITRNIASQGGAEMFNVAILRQLTDKFGANNGMEIFSDLFPDDEAKAAVSITSRDFSNLPEGDRSIADQKRDAAHAMRYAQHLPLSLALGPGTGNSAIPAAAPASSTSQMSTTIQNDVATAAASINAWGRSLHGGSFAYAVSGSRTASGNALLASNPQLDYSYPSELYELEVHGGGYDARGIGVPSIPTVGIGHTANVAWALTTGYSKTIDSFIETTRKNPAPGGPTQYLHDGIWRNEACRTVNVRYRTTGPEGVPVGAANKSQRSQVCRTIHGPIVATSTSGKRARSLDFAQWKQDDQTVAGILDWDRAQTLKQVKKGVKKVRWNENIIAADSAGNIGYWHPGRYFRHAPGIDQRFPLKGTGSQDERGYLKFSEMPHLINPSDGYVANWNTKPAHGWVDGDLSGTNTRPAGPANRYVDLQRLLARGHDLTAASMARIEERVGEDDHRFRGYLPVLKSMRDLGGITGVNRTALNLMVNWDGRAYAPGAPGGSSPRSTPVTKVTDGPAATVFVEFTKQIKSSLFRELPPTIRARLDTVSAESHQYDVTPLDNDALGLLRPGFTSLVSGVSKHRRGMLERKALIQAVRVLRKTYGAKPVTWRRPHGISHINSLSGVVGPSKEMPFQDRGTWVQEIAFN